MYPSLLISLLMAGGFVVFMAVTSDSPLLVWFVMEVNLYVYLGVSHYYSPQFIKIGSALKYFMFQTMASSILVLCLLQEEVLNLLVFAIIWAKLGGAPFHSWFFSCVMENSDKLITKVLLIHQKLPPLILFYNMGVSSEDYISLIIIGALFVSLKVLMINTTPLKLILVSSLFSNLWLLMSLMSAPFWGLLYFMVYMSGVNFMLNTYYVLKNKGYFPGLLVGGQKKSKEMFWALIYTAGIPPSPLFFIKMKIIYSASFIHPWSIVSMLVIFTALSLKAFLNIIYNHSQLGMKYFHSVGVLSVTEGFTMKPSGLSSLMLFLSLFITWMSFM